MTLAAVPNQPELEGGPRPERAPGESWESLAGRMATWAQTPAGAAAIEAEEKRLAAQKTREEQDRRIAWSDKIGIPERYRFMGEPGFEPQPTQAMAAVREPVELVVLSGAAGCGKTAAACWWLYNGKGGGRAPVFMTAARLSRLSKFDDEAMGRILKAARLVIDDLAVEYADEKGFFRSLLDEVINERYGSRLPTLITTNITAADFKERCGERITDRVREAGRFVSLDNPSMRRRP